MAALTRKQKLFADYWLSGMSAVKAYQAAGYKARSYDSSRAMASQSLSKPNVKEYIERQQHTEDEQRQRAREQRMKRIEEVAGLAVEQLEKKVKEGNLSAIFDALDRAGMKPTEKVEHSGKVGGEFVMRISGIDPSSFPDQKNE